jgi:hypothetical protein
MFRIFIQDNRLNCTRQLCRNRDDSIAWWEADGYKIEGHAFETLEEAEQLLKESNGYIPYGCVGNPRIENWSF